jgi:hypothetical protein
LANASGEAVAEQRIALALDLEIELVEMRPHDDRTAGAREQRIAVGRGVHDNLQTDVPAGASAIVDHDRLTERFR